MAQSWLQVVLLLVETSRGSWFAKMKTWVQKIRTEKLENDKQPTMSHTSLVDAQNSICIMLWLHSKSDMAYMASFNNQAQTWAWEFRTRRKPCQNQKRQATVSKNIQKETSRVLEAEEAESVEKGTGHDPIHTNSSVKHAGGSVNTDDGTCTLTFIDWFYCWWSNRMNAVLQHTGACCVNQCAHAWT